MYGIIGYGVLGKATAKCLFRNRESYWCHDTNPKKKAPNEIELWDDRVDVVRTTAAVFVCVNTPEHEGRAGYDLTYVHSALDYLVGLEYKGVVIVSSTIGIGDYSTLVNHHKGAKYTLVVSPEFIRAKTADSDMYYPADILYGPPIKSVPVRIAVVTALSDRTDRCAVPLALDPDQCALVKTGRNLALAMKLTSATVTYLEGQNSGMTPAKINQALDMAFRDIRLGQNYHSVGKKPYKLGFGGTCLPKDVAAKRSSPLLPPQYVALINALCRANTFIRSATKD